MQVHRSFDRCRSSSAVTLASLSTLVGLLGVTGCYHGQLDALSTDGATDGDDAGGDGGEGEGAELPAPSSRYYRLTHDQWERTVQDLFYLDAPTGLSEGFRADPNSGGYFFDNGSASLVVDQPLWTGYQAASAEVAALVTDDPATLALIVPPDDGDTAARARTFVETFLGRAYRRPPTKAEVDEHLALFNAAPDLFEGLDPFVAGVRLTIQGVLQSPHFLYRIEESADADGEGEVIPLDDYELASRLSYFLWSSMPDEELFAAAEAGELGTDDGLASQARRMLDDPRSREIINHFHAQLLDAEHFEDISPSPAFFPDVSPEIGAYASEESRRFLDHIVFKRGGSWADVLTSNTTFVNAQLAEIYGLEGDFTEDEFQRVELDPDTRRGVFTQVGFLASNASAVDPDPIHRGVFMVRRVTCGTLNPPPDNITPLPPPQPGQTNRERTADHTEQEGSVCAGCHQYTINPFGFSFEHYDAIGAWRDEDAGKPVDASAEVIIAGETFPVADAVELADVLAEQEAVHRCYASHWIQYANGRPAAPEDDVLATRLAQASLEEGLPIKDLLIELVSSPSFTSRAVEEVQ